MYKEDLYLSCNKDSHANLPRPRTSFRVPDKQSNVVDAGEPAGIGSSTSVDGDSAVATGPGGKGWIEESSCECGKGR